MFILFLLHSFSTLFSSHKLHLEFMFQFLYLKLTKQVNINFLQFYIDIFNDVVYISRTTYNKNLRKRGFEKFTFHLIQEALADNELGILSK